MIRDPSRLGVTVALLALVACTSPTESNDALRVSTTLSTNRLIVGDSVLVDVLVVNATSRTLPINAGPCVLYFEVLDTSGRVVAPESPTCPLVQWVPRLEPGDSLAFSFTWRGQRGGTSEDDFLPLGTYRVRGVFDAAAGPQPSAPVELELIGPAECEAGRASKGSFAL